MWYRLNYLLFYLLRKHIFSVCWELKKLCLMDLWDYRCPQLPHTRTWFLTHDSHFCVNKWYNRAKTVKEIAFWYLIYPIRFSFDISFFPYFSYKVNCVYLSLSISIFIVSILSGIHHCSHTLPVILKIFLHKITYVSHWAS